MRINANLFLNDKVKKENKTNEEMPVVQDMMYQLQEIGYMAIIHNNFNSESNKFLNTYQYTLKNNGYKIIIP